jgi:hypothetical protein
MKERPNGLL